MASGNENNGLHASDNRMQKYNDEAARQLLNTCLSKSWSNPKKRPSASNASDHFETTHHAPTLSEASNGTVSQPQKRSRASAWPLKPTNSPNDRSSTPRRTHQAPLSPGQRHNLSIKPRPSKFLEGSMNDRVSTKPPSIYIRDEAAMEEYHNRASTHGSILRGSNDSSDDKMYCDAGIEITKSSGMYRFGKALVNAFNPVNVWQGINGIWKDKEQPRLSDKAILQERQIKAEKAYAVMKQNGFQGTQPFPTPGTVIDQPSVGGRNRQGDQLDQSFGTSDDVSDQTNPPIKFKHGRPTPASSEDFLLPLPSTESRPGIVSINQGDDGRRSFNNIRRPSLQSLKKVKSHIQLSSTKNRTAVLSPCSDLVPKSNTGQALRRQPSKKDVAKRQKLSKQVSNLEGKLEVARRELQLFGDEIPDVPKIPKSARTTFAPQPLSPLPSESGFQTSKTTKRSARQVESDPDWEPPMSSKARIQNVTPKKSAIKGSAVKTPKITAKPQATGLGSSGKKRKSFGDGDLDRSYKPKSNVGNDSDSELSLPANRTPRARKYQKLDTSPNIHDDGTGTKGSPATVSKGSRTATIIKNQTSVPPVPKLPTPFDPAKVDKMKLLGMRSIRKDELPFGFHLDDIVNLQKEFPHCSQKELDKYLASLSKDHEPTKKSKGLENEQPNAQSLGQLNSASCGKALITENISARAGQACKNSSPNKPLGRELSTIDEAVTVDLSKDRSVPPLPNTFIRQTQSAAAAGIPQGKHIDKPLPKIQKEDYTWPEDVF